MKFRPVVIAVLKAAYSVTVLTGCATTKKTSDPVEHEEIYGTWYKGENNETVTYKSDGHFEDFFVIPNCPAGTEPLPSWKSGSTGKAVSGTGS